MMIFDKPGDDGESNWSRRADYLAILKNRDLEVSGQHQKALASLDREIITELRRVARARRGHWVSQRVVSGMTKRIRGAWRLADVHGLKNWRDRFQFAGRAVSERIEVLTQAGIVHREARFTPTGLERLGYVDAMTELTVTTADLEWLAALHVRWE